MIEYSTRRVDPSGRNHLIVWVTREPSWEGAPDFRHRYSEYIKGWAVEQDSDGIIFHETDVKFSFGGNGDRRLYVAGSGYDATNGSVPIGVSIAGAILFPKMMSRLERMIKIGGDGWHMRERKVRL